MEVGRWMTSKHVLVGMSGGVDSSVCAAMLLQKGYRVTGITIRFHDEEEAFHEAFKSAAQVAHKLGIEHISKDYTELFKSHVVNYFVDEYTVGNTPNPCIFCNPNVKFRALIETADEHGCDFIASGHYCRIQKNTQTERYEIHRAKDTKKDQTYFLYRLTQGQLARIQMPLGEFTKTEIRGFATEMGLPVAQKHDSQEICFIPNGNYIDFIEKTTGKAAPEGDFTDASGKVLGRHKGITRYTVGQRKGLGDSFGRPYFVTGIDPCLNRVILGEDADTLSNWLIAENIRMSGLSDFTEPIRVYMKARSTAELAPAWLYPCDHDSFKVVFDSPQRALTPGQSAVAYRDDIVLCGGIITRGGR